VKRTPLANYRVVYFATHGLLAGDVKGLGEPALALTIPKEPIERDTEWQLHGREGEEVDCGKQAEIGRAQVHDRGKLGRD
jgi:hypothetical protein